MGPLPDLASLRCFLAGAEQPSFRAAARAVALSPAAFSDRIRRLEDDLGTALFERTTRTVALTAAGRRLLPEARACLDQARRCAHAAMDESARPPLTLTLGTRYELGLSWLVPELESLAAERPERTLHLWFGSSDDLLHRTVDGRLDAMISSARLTRSGLTYATLHAEAYDFVAAPETLARRPLNRPSDAAGHTLVDMDPSLPLLRYLLDAVGTVGDWPFAGMAYLGTIAAIRHRVLEGAGVAVLPRYFVAPDLAEARLVRLLPEVDLLSDAFRLVWRTGSPYDDALRELATALRLRPLR